MLVISALPFAFASLPTCLPARPRPPPQSGCDCRRGPRARASEPIKPEPSTLLSPFAAPRALSHTCFRPRPVSLLSFHLLSLSSSSSSSCCCSAEISSSEFLCIQQHRLSPLSIRFPPLLPSLLVRTDCVCCRGVPFSCDCHFHSSFHHLPAPPRERASIFLYFSSGRPSRPGL